MWGMIPSPATDGRIMVALDDSINPKSGRKIFGSVAKKYCGRESAPMMASLCGEKKQLFNKINLIFDIPFFNPFNLSLSNHVHRFIAP